MTKTTTSLVTFLVAVMPSASAWAEAAPELGATARRENTIAVTVSPVHFALPMGEVMGELRLHPKLSAAAILGGGSVDGFIAYEGGGQFNYYVLGGFDHGMQLGIEAMYLHVDGDVGAFTGAASGLTAGPYVGYKRATSFGFTINAQVGAQVVLASASASGQGQTTMTSESKVLPLVNLNAGWSF